MKGTDRSPVVPVGFAAVLGLVSARSYRDLGLAANTTYAYQVRAVDGNGNVSSLSGAIKATTKR